MKTKTLLPILTLLLATLAAPADANHRRHGWTSLPCDNVCIGGGHCSPRYGNALELPLDGRPVEAVRFYAHDHVGNKHKAKLRVAIDGYELADYLDVKRDGSVFELDAHGLDGRYLLFTAVANDEIVIEDVEVLYGGHRGRHSYREPPYRPAGHRTAWRSIRGAGGCFGGEICGDYGSALEVRLSGSPIYGLRFYAHDAVGNKTGGRLRIWIDGAVVEHSLDVKRAGGVYELDLGGVRGHRLVFEATTNDEVVVEDIEIRYGSGRGWRR